MSITESLKVCLSESMLVEIKPLLGGQGGSRSIFVTSYVFRQLDPITAEADLSEEAGRIRRKLENFVIGSRVVVGERRAKDCDIKRLDPAFDEVWEIRERQDPSIRIFGRFMEKDCFIATNIRLISDLFSIVWVRRIGEVWPVWNQEIRLCKTRWRHCFNTYQPHSGEYFDDYLSNAIGSRSI